MAGNKVYYTSVSQDHRHIAYLGESGTGETSFDNDHKHEVVKWIVQPTNNHTHEILRNK